MKHAFYDVQTKICNTSPTAESINSIIGARQNPEIEGKSQDTSSAIDLITQIHQIHAKVEVQVQIGTGYSTPRIST